jgi:hypothetical protein
MAADVGTGSPELWWEVMLVEASLVPASLVLTHMG